MSFPTVLNMNEYMQGYDGIENKLYDKEVELVTKHKGKQIEENIQ